MRTPVGRFRIAEKIGAGNPTKTAYKNRKPVRASAKTLQAGDLVMSRILWLDGIEPGNANTFERYIYIHGTPEERNIGRPASYGCVRMRSSDVIGLYDIIGQGARVSIVNTPLAAEVPALAPPAAQVALAEPADGASAR